MAVVVVVVVVGVMMIVGFVALKNHLKFHRHLALELCRHPHLSLYFQQLSRYLLFQFVGMIHRCQNGLLDRLHSIYYSDIYEIELNIEDGQIHLIKDGHVN